MHGLILCENCEIRMFKGYTLRSFAKCDLDGSQMLKRQFYVLG